MTSGDSAADAPIAQTTVRWNTTIAFIINTA